MLDNMEAERARNRLTKAELCSRLNISEKSYRAYVQGRAIPSDKLVRMASLFGCSTDYLLGLTNHYSGGSTNNAS